MEGRIGVFLVANNRLLRESLERILRKRSDISVLGAVPFSSDVLEVISESLPQVLLFDSLDGEPAEFELIQAARQTLPQIKVVLIGMENDAKVFLTAVRSGAVGYVLKDAGAMDVVNAVRAVSHEEAVCPPALCLTLFDEIARESPARRNGRRHRKLGLSRREQQLLPLIAEGLTNKEIATRLNLSEQTVKNHIHRMLHKVGAPDRASVVEICSSSELDS